MADPHIRAADPADATALCSVRREALTSLASSVYSQKQVDAWIGLVSTEACRSAILQRQQRIFVACVHGQVVGYAGLKGQSLWSVYVGPAFARRGIGSLLVGCAERQALRGGVEELWVAGAVSAVRFYERLGYRVHARHEAVLPSRGVPETGIGDCDSTTIPVIAMRKQLQYLLVKGDRRLARPGRRTSTSERKS